VVAAGAEFGVQLVGAAAAFLLALVQVGQVPVQEVGLPGRGVREQASASASADGLAVEVQVAADLSDGQAAGPRRGRLGRGDLFAQAGAVAGGRPLDRLSEIVQQVPPVGDLDGERGAAGRPLTAPSGIRTV
jgi:hypothetical protein